MWLTDEQVADLTKRKRVKDQVTVLTHAGIPFRMVAGRPVVVESALLAVPHTETPPRVRRL